jgi:hypothetical protein
MDVRPIAHDKPALFSVFTLQRLQDEADTRCRQLPDFVARDADGARSEQAIALRRFFDLDAPRAEAASPRTRARSQRGREGGR